MIVISGNLVLLAASPTGLPGGLTLDHPVIGWHNVVRYGYVSADSEDPEYPVNNLANPATHLEWRSETTVDQVVAVSTGYADDLDYVAIARHNFGSAEIAVSVGYFLLGVWQELVEETMPADDGPLILRFTPQSRDTVIIKMAAGSAPPRAAVIYVGSLLVVERKIYVGHTPLPHARKFSIVNGRSESGNFLGRIVLGEWRESTIPLSLISPDWYREYMDPFLAVADETPFFFAWRPQTYPAEVGYAFLLDDPMPTPVGPSNRIAFDLKVGGVV